MRTLFMTALLACAAQLAPQLAHAADAGKIIFHAFRGEFMPPRACSFIAPRGPSTELRDLLLNPSKFKAEVMATWDVRVARRVVADEKHLLTGTLKAYVEAYDFSSFRYATLDEGPELFEELLASPATIKCVIRP